MLNGVRCELGINSFAQSCMTTARFRLRHDGDIPTQLVPTTRGSCTGRTEAPSLHSFTEADEADEAIARR